MTSSDDNAPTTTTASVAGQKRSNPSGTSTNGPGFRAVKRRASKACQCCRARKVRCNVVEHGAPCTNCRLDEVECIVTESKRRKKNWGVKLDASNNAAHDAHHHSGSDHSNHSPSALSIDGHSDKESGGHVPHLILKKKKKTAHALDWSSIQDQTQSLRRASFASSHASLPSLSHSLSTNSSTSSTFPHRHSLSLPSFELPAFIKPTPSRISAEDLEYLWKKGALSLPEEPLRTALLDAHFNYMHPYMPLLNKREFLDIVNTEDGSKGKVGLLLFQAVMFIGTSYVDVDILRAAGYSSRKAARKAFFIKARLLYDFDHEQDRMLLVQALLLMSYWYETPDDQKDTWHWMGVAISLSHTIGLHRNPEKSSMDIKRQKLWKRIWWSCYMRDRLVALGMRRPTRIKTEDCDVPMLTLSDFDIDTGIDENEALFWTMEERARREADSAREKKLANLCIEKAKLCVCISNVLAAQYSVLNTNQGSLTADGSTRTTMMLLPKKLEPGCSEVQTCDEELEAWVAGLPEDAIYQNPTKGNVDHVFTLHQGLLHLVYNTTVSALHRPQVLPSSPSCPPIKRTEQQDVSRKKVRQAASEITRLAEDLIEYDLVKYLPTTGVTVILPAVIIHLLDIKSSNPVTRELSLEGFALCMQVLQRLRQTYSAADYATHFLEAAIKKAGIPVDNLRKHASRRRARYHANTTTTLPDTPNAISIPTTAPPSNAAPTPPPETMLAVDLDESDLQLKLESFLQTSPTQHSMYIHETSEDMPDFAMPDADDSLEALMSAGDSDPFLGHDGVGSLGAGMMNAKSAFGMGNQWASEDMGRILDGVDLSFDDVIQVLETEIN
ncbi:fungal-specific transcription factor domain-containing protein [Geopyxis carbonaria]|nr:fungal-specific transcription factor domain-containing protein [Geopyxis carbonaria]